jgi:hypothetical protein
VDLRSSYLGLFANATRSRISGEEEKEHAVQSGFSKGCAGNDRCDLCRHEEVIPGRKLCSVCLEAIARLAYATSLLTDLEMENCPEEGRAA